MESKSAICGFFGLVPAPASAVADGYFTWPCRRPCFGPPWWSISCGDTAPGWMDMTSTTSSARENHLGSSPAVSLLPARSDKAMSEQRSRVAGTSCSSLLTYSSRMREALVQRCFNCSTKMKHSSYLMRRASAWLSAPTCSSSAWRISSDKAFRQSSASNRVPLDRIRGVLSKPFEPRLPQLAPGPLDMPQFNPNLPV